MQIDAGLGDVQLAALEPADIHVALKTGVFDPRPRIHPHKISRNRPPERFGVGNRLRV